MVLTIQNPCIMNFLANYLSPFILLLLISYSPALARSGTIDELIKDGSIDLKLTSLGSHSQECISVYAINNTNEAIRTSIEPGRMLMAGNESEQDILVTQELILALAPEQSVKNSVFGYCCQSQDDNPTYGSDFTLGEMASPQLLELAQYLNKRPDLPSSARQSAIWVVSDCHPLSSIRQTDQTTADLGAYVAESLGMPKSWYSTVHKQEAGTFFSERVEKLEGEIPFEITGYDRVNVIIIDADGNVVKQLLSSTIYGPGDYTYPLKLWVASWNHGEYEVKLETDSKELVAEYEFQI